MAGAVRVSGARAACPIHRELDEQTPTADLNTRTRPPSRGACRGEGKCIYENGRTSSCTIGRSAESLALASLRRYSPCTRDSKLEVDHPSSLQPLPRFGQELAHHPGRLFRLPQGRKSARRRAFGWLRRPCGPGSLITSRLRLSSSSSNSSSRREQTSAPSTPRDTRAQGAPLSHKGRKKPALFSKNGSGLAGCSSFGNQRPWKKKGSNPDTHSRRILTTASRIGQTQTSPRPSHSHSPFSFGTWFSLHDKLQLASCSLSCASRAGDKPAGSSQKPLGKYTYPRTSVRAPHSEIPARFSDFVDPEAFPPRLRLGSALD